MSLFLKNTAGQPSASFTFMVIGFAVITLWLVLSIAETLGPIHIRPFNAGDAMAYFVPLATLYFSRRYTAGNGSVAALPVVIPATPTSDPPPASS
jgi:hypothetical protein